jgi:hypothetical protein
MQDLVTKPSRNSTDVEAWSSHHQGRSMDGFGASAMRVDTSLMYFEGAFDPDHSKVVVIDLHFLMLWFIEKRRTVLVVSLKVIEMLSNG